MNSGSQFVILLADNSPDYRNSLRGFLELGNFKVEEADSLMVALDKLETTKIDLALADLRLAQDSDEYDISGLEVAKKAKDKHIPCIIVTAFPSVEATRLALRSRGVTPLAEDFFPKKTGPEALLDVINTVLQNTNDIQVAPQSELPQSELVIDLEQRIVFLKGEHIRLSRNQYNLLAYLFERKGAVCSLEELIEAVYGEKLTSSEAANDRRLERLVERVRQKIETKPSVPQYLIKEFGRGYRLVLDVPTVGQQP